MKKVLILAANPEQATPLRLEQELRDIQEGLERAKMRDHFELICKCAVRPRAIQRALLDERPQIIHFSGHGEGEKGLVFEDNLGYPALVQGEALAELFELFSSDIECVLLNGCYSAVQAESIVQHIDYVIGMNDAINDSTAIEFAVGFYDALGAGRTYEFAYRFACAAAKLNTSAAVVGRTDRDILLTTNESASNASIPVLLKCPNLVEKSRNFIGSSDTHNTNASMQNNPLEFDVAAIRKAGEERVNVLDERISEIQSGLQKDLPKSYQEGLIWLNKNRKSISISASQCALQELSESHWKLSEEDQYYFQWDIEKYVESVYYAASDSSFQILDEPVIGPSINVPEAYKIAFSFIKRKIPGRLDENITKAISERFDYLLERLFIA